MKKPQGITPERDMPEKECPSCGYITTDYDGFGVLYCDKCGYCTHASFTGNICDFCHKSERLKIYDGTEDFSETL